MIKLAIAAMTACLAGAALAQQPADDFEGTCGGILHVITPRLWVGSANAQAAEDLPCFIAQTEVQKVLSACAVGRWCEVAGMIDPNCKPGTCEIKKVTSVSRKRK